MTKCLKKSNLLRTGLFFLARNLRVQSVTAKAWWRSERQLVTWHPQSGSREKQIPVLRLLPPYSVQDHYRGAVLQLSLSGNILIGTSRGSQSDSKASQVNPHSLPMCALQQRKLRLRRLTKAAEAHRHTD